MNELTNRDVKLIERIRTADAELDPVPDDVLTAARAPSKRSASTHSRTEDAMRNALTVLASLVAILATASTAVAQTQTVTVTRFGCDSVTVEGAGWEQTEATVEIAIPPSESGEGLEDLVAGPVQSFRTPKPTSQPRHSSSPIRRQTATTSRLSWWTASSVNSPPGSP